MIREQGPVLNNATIIEAKGIWENVLPYFNPESLNISQLDLKTL